MRRPTTIREVDALSGAIVATLGLFMLYQSMQMSFYADGVPGPGFFPALLAAALIVLGASLVVTRLRKPQDAADRHQLPNRRQASRALSLWITALAATLLVDPLGFPLAMFLLVALILFVIEGRRGLGAIATAILIPLLAWLLFAELLLVPLPAGPLFGS
jgi:putative tricarboxylic transport membrane protein